MAHCGSAPWGVTDLKAAVRTLRYNAGVLPGNMDRIFSFGHSGGGAQSSLLGATGDADDYTPYLEKIGAALKDASGNALSDAIFGSMCWCPITCLDYASEAYEWNMGQFSTSDTRADGTFTKSLSNDMVNAWAEYINKLGLVDDTGTKLTLQSSGSGIYLSGSYYEYVKNVIQTSLNHFLADTTFPYTPSNSMKSDMGAGGGAMTGGGGSNGGAPSGGAPSGASGGTRPSGSMSGSAPAGMGASTSSSSSTTYNTVQEYIASLNASSTWVTYDAASNTATITGIGDFVKACKSPSKSVGAFDALDRSQAENAVFGCDTKDALHFDYSMKKLLNDKSSTYSSQSNWNSSYPGDYTSDIDVQDGLGNPSQVRQDLYNPLYYLVAGFYDGAGRSKPAAHWRIRTGIAQGDTANTTEINLALALKASSAVKAVDFETVWAQGHTTAERTGTSTSNFIAWVKESCA